MSYLENYGPALAAGVASYFLFTNCIACALFIAILVHVVVHRKYFGVLLTTFPRDAAGVRFLMQVKLDMNRRLRQNRTIDQIFTSEVLPRYRSKVAMISVESGREWTFEDLDQQANQVAHYFKSCGLREGDVVALFMNNCPEYVVIWLGLARIGVVTAWINSNLRHSSLVHCIQVAQCKAVVCDVDLQDAVGEVLTGEGALEQVVPVHVFGAVHNAVLQQHKAADFASALSEHSTMPGNFNVRTTFNKPLCYIYTSGTTGLPKAAIMKHVRFYYMTCGTSTVFGLGANDRIYVCMPMYHSAAGILGVGPMLCKGATLVIRKKFSASRFWSECVQHRCTATQYIGEVCRYLLAQPVSDAERSHSIRLMYGNGLRPDIWRQVEQRYGIRRIGEFYGSTEGNSNIVNTDNHEGAVGFFPLYPGLHHLLPVSLIKVDETTGDIIRDADGMCIRCGPGETGQMVGKVVKTDPLLDFEGYVGKKETEKKIVRDVFTKGDFVFSSGDLLYMDELGYLYFKDRTGDTFRWKGENVSTTEVESVLHRLLSLSDATVFGVQIPGCDGRAGMAAVVDENDNVDLEQLNAGLKQKLPVYARPVFLRVCKTVEQTGTFKLKKTNLQKDAYSVAKCAADKLYYLDAKSGQYAALTADVEQRIHDGGIRF